MSDAKAGGYLDDPRVLFAAERTLLAWVRTSVTLMGLGFVVARFGVFLAAVQGKAAPPGHGLSAWIGIAFVVLATVVLAVAARQHVRFLRSLGTREIPRGYGTWLPTFTAAALAVTGGLLALYLLLETGA
jgi:putative membrane protein